MRVFVTGGTGQVGSRLVKKLLEVAKARDLAPARVALAWLQSRPGVVAPIIGATKLAHLEDAVAALEVKLSPEEIAKLEAPYKPHPILGHDQPRPA